MKDHQTPQGREAGMSIVEALVAVVIVLFVVLGAYQLLDSSRNTYVNETDLTFAQDTGRSVLDLMVSELRVAGYSPLGAKFDAVPSGSATSLRVLADLDKDGVVGTAGETDENLTHVFDDPDGDGVFRLRRGVDLNGDGNFADAGESIDVVSEQVVQVDLDGDSAPDPFLVYDAAPPATKRITVTFGIRTAHKDSKRRAHIVTGFTSDVVLLNKG